MQVDSATGGQKRNHSGSDGEGNTSSKKAKNGFFVKAHLLGADITVHNPIKLADIFGKIGEYQNVVKKEDFFMIDCTSAKHSRYFAEASGKHQIKGQKIIFEKMGEQKKFGKQFLIFGVSIDVSDGELKAALGSKGVLKIRRFNKNQIPTTTVLLTFDAKVDVEEGEHLFLGFSRFTLNAYINPLRCFKCNRFGHGAGTCRGEETCVRCAGNHNDKTCSESVKCVNCEGNHFASSKVCPVFIENYNIKKFSLEQKISFLEAKKDMSAGSIEAEKLPITSAEGNTVEYMSVNSIITKPAKIKDIDLKEMLTMLVHLIQNFTKQTIDKIPAKLDKLLDLMNVHGVINSNLTGIDIVNNMESWKQPLGYENV